LGGEPFPVPPELATAFVFAAADPGNAAEGLRTLPPLAVLNANELLHELKRKALKVPAGLYYLDRIGVLLNPVLWRFALLTPDSAEWPSSEEIEGMVIGACSLIRAALLPWLTGTADLYTVKIDKLAALMEYDYKRE
jgi:hypothetical protein